MKVLVWRQLDGRVQADVTDPGTTISLDRRPEVYICQGNPATVWLFPPDFELQE